MLVLSFTTKHSSKKPDSYGQELSVVMVGLLQIIHLPIYDWLEEPCLHKSPSLSLPSFTSLALSKSPSNHNGADNIDNDTDNEEEEEEEVNQDLLGFTPNQVHHKHRRQCKHSSFATELLKPCPFEYDSACSSLFIPTHNQYKRLGRSRSPPRRGECQFT